MISHPQAQGELGGQGPARADRPCLRTALVSGEVALVWVLPTTWPLAAGPHPAKVPPACGPPKRLRMPEAQRETVGPSRAGAGSPSSQEAFQNPPNEDIPAFQPDIWRPGSAASCSEAVTVSALGALTPTLLPTPLALIGAATKSLSLSPFSKNSHPHHGAPGSFPRGSGCARRLRPH